MTEKTMRFQGKGTDLIQLQQRVEQQLKIEGYKTQATQAPLGFVIQAQKGGILRDIFAANRAFTILISGQSNDFTVHVGIGKWIQNMGVTAVETLLLSGLFLVVDVPEMAWTMHVENGIARMIRDIVGSAPTAEHTGTAAEMVAGSSPAAAGTSQ